MVGVGGFRSWTEVCVIVLCAKSCTPTVIVLGCFHWRLGQALIMLTLVSAVGGPESEQLF